MLDFLEAKIADPQLADSLVEAHPRMPFELTPESEVASNWGMDVRTRRYSLLGVAFMLKRDAVRIKRKMPAVRSSFLYRRIKIDKSPQRMRHEKEWNTLPSKV